nr:hypothetical protein BaRGS_011129 [Batillaria attramentaria]
MGRLLSEVVHKPQNLVEKVIEEAYTMDLKQFKQLETAATASSRQDSAETDTKPPALDQTHASEELSAQSPIKDWTVESTGSAVKVTSEVKLKDLTLPESTGVLKEEPHESMQDEDESFMQPVRKSQRRNRGQRYQELINEGIIQPSKERLAARRHELTTPYTVSSYHLGEEAGTDEDGERRHSLKRSISESDSISGDEKRYRTGDFDLEAEIATLPPCSLEQLLTTVVHQERASSTQGPHPNLHR